MGVPFLRVPLVGAWRGNSLSRLVAYLTRRLASRSPSCLPVALAHKIVTVAGLKGGTAKTSTATNLLPRSDLWVTARRRRRRGDRIPIVRKVVYSDWKKLQLTRISKKMRLDDYIKRPKQERQLHADLQTPCQRQKKTGINKARINLMAFLGITQDTERSQMTPCCHLCTSNSSSGSPCHNPKHLYFGTRSENELDKPHELRREIARQIGAKGGTKGGHAAMRQKKGVHDPANKEKCREGNRKGGAKGGVIGGANTARQRRQCLMTGHISNPGGLAVFQRARGIPTD